MNNPDKNDLPLVTAILDWFRRASLAAFASAAEWQPLPGKPFAVLDDLGAEEALGPILELLGSNADIKNTDDLDFLLRHELRTAAREGGWEGQSIFEVSADQWAAQLMDAFSKVAARLRTPVRSWTFRVAVAAGCQFRLDRQLGGRFRLFLQSSAEEAPFQSVVLSGVVQAISPHKARFIVEDVVRRVVGACWALGLGAPNLIPSGESSVLILTSDDGDFEFPLHPVVGGLLPRVFFHVPFPSNELEASLIESRRDEFLERRFRPLERIVSAKSERAAELRNGCALLFDALAARDEGTSVTTALMAAEAVLLEKSDSSLTLARLKEAVAYRLGTSAEMRSDYRKEVAELYAARSNYVHTGKLGGPPGSRHRALGLAGRILEVELLGFAEAVERQ